MPLFFVITGIFIKEKPFNFRREFKYLVLPYLLVTCICVILRIAKDYCLHGILDFDCALAALYGNGSKKFFLDFFHRR